MNDSRKYKIAICTPALYSAGGVERVVTVKANYFAEQLGYDVTIIVTDGNGGNSFFLISPRIKIINLGLSFEELWNIPFISKVFLYLKKQRRYKKVLSRELRRIKPDITITTLRREINFLCDIDDGSYKIGELHQSRQNYRCVDSRKLNVFKKWFSKWWQGCIVSHLKKLDSFVVLTESAVSEWPEIENVRLIPDPLSFTPKQQSPLSVKRVVTIGRYSAEKGFDLLLKVWAVVEKEFADWQLDVYGMGDPYPYMKMMDDLSIDTTRCHLNTRLLNVENEYFNSSILAHPSRTEGFGLVLVEAMACGLPVVSFDCENGPRSIITNGENGFLVPAFDEVVFADRLMALMKDEKLRKSMGAKGRETSQQYDIKTVCRQWQQLFDELMQKDGV